MTKEQLLADFLELTEEEAEDIKELDSRGHYEIHNREYLVLSDCEADQLTGERIQESLWAFNSHFLARMTELPVDVFACLSEQYEKANEPIKMLIEKTCGLQELVNEAIAIDGRGHFLADYDHEEHEHIGMFIYRVN